jgi:hypothetical protein
MAHGQAARMECNLCTRRLHRIAADECGRPIIAIPRLLFRRVGSEKNFPPRCQIEIAKLLSSSRTCKRSASVELDLSRSNGSDRTRMGCRSERDRAPIEPSPPPSNPTPVPTTANESFEPRHGSRSNTTGRLTLNPDTLCLFGCRGAKTCRHAGLAPRYPLRVT